MPKGPRGETRPIDMIDNAVTGPRQMEARREGRERR